jgi:hypothetical protein
MKSIYDVNPGKAALSKHVDDTVKIGAGDKPVFGFEMVTFD